jgi:hypothetical protein
MGDTEGKGETLAVLNSSPMLDGIVVGQPLVAQPVFLPRCRRTLPRTHPYLLACTPPRGQQRLEIGVIVVRICIRAITWILRAIGTVVPVR